MGFLMEILLAAELPPTKFTHQSASNLFFKSNDPPQFYKIVVETKANAWYVLMCDMQFLHLYEQVT